MRDIDLYAQILGLSSPWQVVSVAVDRAGEEVRVQVAPEPGTRWSCPKCGQGCAGYDSRRRRWRHLDTCQYKTVLETDVPRVTCPEHGVVSVAVDRAGEEVRVQVAPEPGTRWSCPKCGQGCAGYDSRRRRWRHLDTCQYKTVLETDVPRVTCPEHGVVTVAVPWAEPGSGFTALFEALIIDWLKEASIQAVARQLRVSWNAIDAVMRRAVQRGLLRRQGQPPRAISVDETAFKRGHEYVTIVSDQDRGVVVHVADERKTQSLAGYYERLPESHKLGLEAVAMDMWPAYIAATEAHIPGAREKIAFDKFHVAKYLGEAVDRVRRQEHRALLGAGQPTLKGSKYQWLTNPANMSRAQRQRFRALRDSTLKTARAWAIKEFAMGLWHYASRTWAAKGWARWMAWAVRGRLEPVKKAAATLKRHLWGIINAVVLKVHNGHAESMNSRIQRLKKRANGFRNRARFHNAIYFHLGGLDLYPNGLDSR